MNKSCLKRLLVGFGLLLLTACAGSQSDSFEHRLHEMSDEQLVNYYQGLNDRIKDIQSETKNAESQGGILQDDHVARTPYLFGGEAWNLEQKATKVKRELDRRNLRY